MASMKGLFFASVVAIGFTVACECREGKCIPTAPTNTNTVIVVNNPAPTPVPTPTPTPNPAPTGTIPSQFDFINSQTSCAMTLNGGVAILNWTPSTGSVMYFVERRTWSGGTWDRQATVPIDRTSFTQQVPNASHYYRIIAVGSQGYEVRSQQAEKGVCGNTEPPPVIVAPTPPVTPPVPPPVTPCPPWQVGTPPNCTTPPLAPTVGITVDPSTITAGASSFLAWSAGNVTTCTASNGWTGSKPAAGGQSVSPSATTTYTLTCTGPGGTASASATLTVNPAPVTQCAITARDTYTAPTTVETNTGVSVVVPTGCTWAVSGGSSWARISVGSYTPNGYFGVTTDPKSEGSATRSTTFTVTTSTHSKTVTFTQ